MGSYRGQFKNINEETYTITIESHIPNPSQNTPYIDLTFGESPCIITSESDGIFSPIKSRSCTIELMTDSWLFDLYSPTAKGCVVTVSKGLTTVFYGYLTPNSYDQSYTYIDNISLEAVDAVSVLKEFKYSTVSTIPTYQKVIDIIVRLLNEAGYGGMLYIPNSYTGYNGTSNSGTINNIYVSEANFFDDDDEHTPWTQYDVLEELMRFLGWSLCPYGDDVYCVDYKMVKNSNNISYSSYEISTGIRANANLSLNAIQVINKDAYASGEPTLSMDEVYNKIEISDNLYEIEDIAPDVFEDENHISVNEEVPFYLDSRKWVTTTTKKHWLRPDEVSSSVTGYTYQTICRVKPTTNWKHHFYRMSTITTSGTPTEVINQNGKNYYDGDIGSAYTSAPVNHYCNTHGCLIQHFAYRKNDGFILPTSLDWEDYLTFFVTNDKVNTNGSINYQLLKKLELPVLEYTVPEEVMFKPGSGKSWITIKGDLFYQYNAKVGNNNMHIINTTDHLYTTAPVEKSSDIDTKEYLDFVHNRVWGFDRGLLGIWNTLFEQAGIPLPEFGKGFEMWKMKVQLGNKYWNGTSWTTTESTFYIPYGNNPSSSDMNEYIPAFGWASLVPNTDYTDKVGEQAYCIPISATDINAPSFGELKVTIYTPLLMPKIIFDLFDALGGDTIDFVPNTWTDLPPVIYCKDFEIGYVYTDDNIWFSQHNSNKTQSDDVIFTNVINDDYVKDFPSLELKINTQQYNKPISRSFITSDTTYITSLKHRHSTASKEQEKNLIDLYYDHYSEPKRIYECNLHQYLLPYAKLTTTALGGTYMVDSQEFDLKANNTRIKLIEY